MFARIRTMEKKKNRQEVKCPHCAHKFLTASKLGLISCGDCGSKFKRIENQVRPKSQEKLK